MQKVSTSMNNSFRNNEIYTWVLCIYIRNKDKQNVIIDNLFNLDKFVYYEIMIYVHIYLYDSFDLWETVPFFIQNPQHVSNFSPVFAKVFFRKTGSISQIISKHVFHAYQIICIPISALVRFYAPI